MPSPMVRGFCLVGVLLTCGWPISAQAEEGPNRYALVVGVGEYPVTDLLSDLRFTEQDAEGIAEVLKTTGYKVTLMTQKASEGQGKRRYAPNAAFIRKEFEGLVKIPFLEKDDCLIVMLAGHGFHLKSRTDPQKVGYFFCPADAKLEGLNFLEDVRAEHNLISIDELYETMNRSSAGVKLLVVDACRNDPTVPVNHRYVQTTNRPPVEIPSGGIAALYSCSKDETALEDAELKQGVFSYYLVEALSGKGDLDQNGEITMTEIHQYVAKKVYTYVWDKYRQQQLPEFTGKVQGNPVLASFSNKPTVPKPLPQPDPMPNPGVQTEFTGKTAGDILSDNSLKMKFAWCPPGTFLMGSPKDEPQRFPQEDQVQVTLTQGFWMGQYEITQQQWQEVMGTTLRDQRNKTQEGSVLYGIGPDHPMYWVNWHEAMEFCRKFTEQERKAGRLPPDWEYTLPTEAQWEYACRAGTATATAFGNSLDSTQAKFSGKHPYNGASQGPADWDAVPVGKYKPNAWGFYDMHGNVNEWCRDRYQERLPGGNNPEVTRSSSKGRIYRGGFWGSYGWFCRSACRLGFEPEERSAYTGFRVAIVRKK